jgi:hypothetical protein
MRSLTRSALSNLTFVLAALIFLGPIAGLALYKAEQSMNSGKAGFVLLMSIQRGAIG